MAFRNERCFYRRTCGLTGKDIISVYSPDKPYVVYDHTDWWRDDWEPLATGREIDYSRPFFEQYEELARVSPRPSLINVSSENSLYTNHAGYNRNCYMCINTGYSEDMLYCSNWCIRDKDCVDCFGVNNSERCYFSVDCEQCAFSSFLHLCRNCTDSHFCYDCQSCSHCYGCFGLRRKEYHIFNEPLSKSDYFKRFEQLKNRTWDELIADIRSFRERVSTQAPHRALWVEKCELSTGDYLRNSKNLRHCFNLYKSNDCAYCYNGGEIVSSMDAYEPYQGELIYEVHAGDKHYNVLFSSKCHRCRDILYSQYCFDSSSLFGCIGLKRESHCILNKSYSESDYEKEKARLIEHMKETGEWGEFFPLRSAPFAYNETVAQDYYPLSKEEAITLGSKWRDKDEKEYQPQTAGVPELISDVSDSITKEVLTCADCERNYRITALELGFYRKESLPIPLLCPECRYTLRRSWKNPRALYERPCAGCQEEIQTSYPEEYPGHVLCEQCYVKALD